MFYSAAAEEESSHHSFFPTSTTCCPPRSWFIFFFLLFPFTLTRWDPRSLIVHHARAQKTHREAGLAIAPGLLQPASCFSFWTSGGGTCCCNLYTYHNASLIADQCISMFRGGGKQRRRDFKKWGRRFSFSFLRAHAVVESLAMLYLKQNRAEQATLPSTWLNKNALCNCFLSVGSLSKHSSSYLIMREFLAGSHLYYLLQNNWLLEP